MTVSFPAVKRSLYRAMTKVLPKNAPDVESILLALEDADFMQKYGTTVSGKRFFEFSYCVFASDEIIEEYEAAIPVERRQFLMDATFKICPFGQFNQILIIYIAYLDSVNILFSCHWNEKTNGSVYLFICSMLCRSYTCSCHANGKHVMSTYLAIFMTTSVRWKAVRS